jgi:hypothetical protein
LIAAIFGAEFNYLIGGMLLMYALVAPLNQSKTTWYLSAPLGLKKRGTNKGLYRNSSKTYMLGYILVWSIYSKHTE